MKITQSVDDEIVLLASKTAQKMGKTLNQAVCDYLEQLAWSANNEPDWKAFEQRCLNSSGRLNGWKFDREEANVRR